MTELPVAAIFATAVMTRSALAESVKKINGMKIHLERKTAPSPEVGSSRNRTCGLAASSTAIVKRLYGG